MLNSEDLEYILKNLPAPSEDDKHGVIVRSKLDILMNQMSLQSEFQERSLELRKQMEELTKEWYNLFATCSA